MRRLMFFVLFNIRIYLRNKLRRLTRFSQVCSSEAYAVLTHNFIAPAAMPIEATGLGWSLRDRFDLVSDLRSNDVLMICCSERLVELSRQVRAEMNECFAINRLFDDTRCCSGLTRRIQHRNLPMNGITYFRDFLLLLLSGSMPSRSRMRLSAR